jgi:uncharacterized membrane protein YhaH (DUF805 family)
MSQMIKTLEALFSRVSFASGSFQAEGPAILMIPTFVAIIVGFIASLVWAYRDARSRGKHGFLVLLFIFMTGYPLSFVWWLWLRPPITPINLD